jgi:hypothetical protein
MDGGYGRRGYSDYGYGGSHEQMGYGSVASQTRQPGGFYDDYYGAGYGYGMGGMGGNGMMGGMGRGMGGMGGYGSGPYMNYGDRFNSARALSPGAY